MMLSLYAQYLMEKTDDQIIETEQGFATYRYLEKEKSVYIIDLYILPEHRKHGAASTISHIIEDAARAKGYTKMLGSVVPSNKDSTTSIKVLLAHGMKLKSASENFIVFEKEI